MNQNNPMHNVLAALEEERVLLSLFCCARTRSGDICLNPKMANGRCRMHGGTSPGAPKGNQNARKHGRYSVYDPAPLRDIDIIQLASKGVVEAFKASSPQEMEIHLAQVNKLLDQFNWEG